MMEWSKLLSPYRLGREANPVKYSPERSPFQQDIDRIIFSGAFRRLAHKTQVHPLAENDNIHTRLTHSIEVASVGRSLGTWVGARISKRLNLKAVTPDSFGYVVQAACFAHDIGNPPFGHSGEDSIKKWFKKADQENSIFGESATLAQKNDLKFFEGNAQGFRILTQLENNRGRGGLQLTYAVLGTFSKYPSSSAIQSVRQGRYIGEEKNGIFDSEKGYFEKIAKKLGLISRNSEVGSWCRHPLTYLVEAADDICYAIIDIEDGYYLGYISYEDAKNILGPMAIGARLDADLSERETISKLRAVAIGNLVASAAIAFLDNEKKILRGTFDGDLISETKFSSRIKKAKQSAKEKIYWSDRKTKLEIAGSVIISGLLDMFFELVIEAEKQNWDTKRLKGGTDKLLRLIPGGFKGVYSRYQAWLRVTDFISGMTDRYALDLYRKLKGISI
jgi:dGTPase